MAVVGVGHLGYHHARLYHQMEGVDLVGIVDIDRERAERVASELDTVACEDIAQLLDAGTQAVSVATPTSTHHDIAMELLHGGMDVLVEKPIASSVDQAERMVQTAVEADRLIQVGHVERFNGAVIALMDAIRTPRFIECHRLSPYPNRGGDVSVVLDLMIHDLDIVLALDTSDVCSIDAIGVPVFSETEDIANARLRLASGCVVNLTASRISVERMRKIRIFEENAYVSTDYSEQKVLVYRKKPGPAPPGASPMELITIEPMPVRRDEPLKLELESFVACARSRSRPVVSGSDALRSMHVARDIIQFIQEHR